MSQTQYNQFPHLHTFNIDKQSTEKRTLIVVVITFTMMIAEIVYGLLANSMALLADGWHMGTHAFALGISLAAYIIARKHAKNSRFTFGTWKIEILGAYSSALVLAIVAIVMVYSSIERLVHPLSIQYNQALMVAAIGLIVNIVSALILNAGGRSLHHHHHHHHHHHQQQHTHDEHSEHGNHNIHDNNHEDHNHKDHDLNLKSAYLHVIADALTSVFAIGALLGAKYLRQDWLDPFMGIVGAALISRWAYLLLKESSAILLDHNTNTHLWEEIRECIESDKHTKICDFHIWRVADTKYSCILSIVSPKEQSIEIYRDRLRNVYELAHVTIEINECPDGHK
jgi:cation diffusion facilitator family transporter